MKGRMKEAPWISPSPWIALPLCKTERSENREKDQGEHKRTIQSWQCSFQCKVGWKREKIGGASNRNFEKDTYEVELKRRDQQWEEELQRREEKFESELKRREQEWEEEQKRKEEQMK